MFSEYMEVNGVEIINSLRTKTYVDTMLPGVAVKCASATLNEALGHSEYYQPGADNAPWYRMVRPATGRFYGFFPVKIEGAADSTSEISTVELIGSGAAYLSPRHGKLEVRVVVVGIAADDEALAEGITWLKEILSNENCEPGLGCNIGRSVRMFHSTPMGVYDAEDKTRWFYNVAVEEAPKVTKELPSKSGAMKQLEFTLAVGCPWAFTSTVMVDSRVLSSTTTYNDPSGQDCSVVTEAYDNFVNDPFFTAIAQPPQPPNVLPPNLIPTSSWRRETVTFPDTLASRHGRIAPVITVQVGSVQVEYLRLRFYDQADLTGCDYIGEFVISYLPVDSTLILDGRTEEIEIQLVDGRILPASHLVYGSAGRPMEWPEMNCHDTYTLAIDRIASQTGITTTVVAAVRE